MCPSSFRFFNEEILFSDLGRIRDVATSPDGSLILATDGPNGKLTIKLTPTQTNKLFYPKSSYDIMVVDSNGNKIKLLEGFMTLNRSVTI